MLKKTIIFDNLDGEKVTEDFYFNITKAEAAEMEISRKGGFSDYLAEIAKSDDNEEIVRLFKQILQAAIGKRSENGKRFIKSEEIWLDFYQSDAYSEFLMEFFTDPASMAVFIEGVLPKDMDAFVEKAMAAQVAAVEGSNEKKLSDYTDAELLTMSQSAFDEIVGTDLDKVDKKYLILAMRRRNAA